MKIVLTVVVLAAFTAAACSRPAPFRGSVREKFPAQVGNFKLAGEVKPIQIPPPNKYQRGEGRPTEGANAGYNAADGRALKLQVVNYESAAAAAEALKLMQENISELHKDARTVNTARTNGAGRATGRRLTVENFVPQVHQIFWNDASLLYSVSGGDLKSLTEFEQSLP